MNEDKLDAASLYCPICGESLEYVDGIRRAICHECGSQYEMVLGSDVEGNYPRWPSDVSRLNVDFQIYN